MAYFWRTTCGDEIDIADGATINRIKAQCRKGRMHYLQEEGLLKVIDGTTSMNEILRCLRTNGK